MRLPFPDLLATRKGRLTTFFLLYVTEGIPLGFTATAIATQMRRQGLGPAAIGMFVGSLYLPWAFKWLVGPFVDTFSSDRFGRRRLWILLTQLGMAATLLVAMPVDYATAAWIVHRDHLRAQRIRRDPGRRHRRACRQRAARGRARLGQRLHVRRRFGRAGDRRLGRALSRHMAPVPYDLLVRDRRDPAHHAVRCPAAQGAGATTPAEIRDDRAGIGRERARHVRSRCMARVYRLARGALLA